MHGIDPDHLLGDVIRPVLSRLALVHPAMGGAAPEFLVLGTAAAESEMGHALHQRGGGGALGAWQIEPATARDLMGRYLPTRPDIQGVVYSMTAARPDTVADFLAGDLYLGCALARLKYWTDPDPLPPAERVLEQAATWKAVFNTALGKGTVEHYRLRWMKYVRPSAERAGITAWIA